MKITVNRNEFRKAVQVAGGVIYRRNCIPILSHVLLEVNGNGLTVTGTNMDVTAQVNIDAEDVPKTRVAFTVEKSRLLSVVTAMTGEFLHLETVARDAETPTDGLKITADGEDEMCVTLPSLDPSDFPIRPPLGTGPRTVRAEIDAAALSHAIGRVAFAISTEETRYYLNGVHMHVYDADRLAVVATDGHRMARYIFEAPGDWLTESVIIPREAITHLAPLLKSAGDGAISVLFGDTNEMEFAAGNWRIATKLIDGTFPDYGRVIPERAIRPSVVDRARTLRAINLTSALAAPKSTPAAKLNFSGSRLTIRGGDRGDGTTSLAAVPCVHHGKEFTIGFNGRYLRDVLNRCSGDTVTLHMTDAASPTLVEDSDDPAFTGILMPMRV